MLLRRKLLIMGVLLLLFALLFLLWGLNADNWDYNLPRRIRKLAAIFMTGGCIGFSAVIFQTITNNRILTPSVMGLDSLYMFVQTIVVFIFGSRQLAAVTAVSDFMISVGIMVGFSLLLFQIVFAGEGRKLLAVILTGMILGGLFESLSTFMQVIIDPNEFLIIQDRMFASFNNVNTSLLNVSAIISVLVFAYGYRQTGQLDVLSLGGDISVNLGIPYNRAVKKYMFLIAVLISVSTALVGPITFLGLLTANLSRQLMKTYKHSYLLSSAILISAIALTFGQFIVERILKFDTTISVIINFIGGIYFIWLLLKEGKL